MSSVFLLAAALALPGGVIEISGDGKSSEIRKDVPQSVTLEPGGIYGFSYSARSDAPAHCLAGTWFAAMGRSEPGDGVWRRRQSLFTALYREKPFQARFHFGQWRPNGKVEIKDAEVVQLKAEYLKNGPLELGGGERLERAQIVAAEYRAWSGQGREPFAEHGGIRRFFSHTVNAV